MDLQSMISAIEAEIPHIDFAEDIARYKLRRNDLATEKYYKGLSAYCKIFRPQNVLDIGTCFGESAVAMAKYAGHILTIDVDTVKLGDVHFTNIQVEQVTALGFLQYDFSQFDLIYVDIDHTGVTERVIHRELMKQYKGIAFWDDVTLSPSMKQFWESVQQEKLDTRWHFSGFGVVRY